MATGELWALADNVAAKNAQKSARHDFQEFNEVLRRLFYLLLAFAY
jgi:hypothetical protein